jgi:DNA-directed RNA polymerase subunit RPC12/RpoP
MVAGNHPCGYVVNIGATRCTATPSHGAVSPNPPPSTDLHCQCPHCGVNLPDKRYKCPYCGQDFVYKCPLCGTTMNSTDTTCPNPACGHTFLTICPQMP